jgi:hypothetical protein
MTTPVCALPYFIKIAVENGVFLQPERLASLAKKA